MKLTKTDKAVVAFLVSLGIFTTFQAKQYVSQLTKKEKGQLISVKNLKDKNIVLCESDPIRSSCDTFNNRKV